MERFHGPAYFFLASAISLLASVEIPSFEEIGKLSAVGFLGIAVIWLLMKTIPYLIDQFTVTVKDITSTHADAVAKAHQMHRDAMDRTDAGFNRLEAAFKEMGSQQIELLSKIAFPGK